jgi:hypothetical protein
MTRERVKIRLGLLVASLLASDVERFPQQRPDQCRPLLRLVVRAALRALALVVEVGDERARDFDRE